MAEGTLTAEDSSYVYADSSIMGRKQGSTSYVKLTDESKLEIKGNVVTCAEENSAAHNSYNDDGAPIYAKWCSPLINTGILSRYKTLKNFFVTVAPYIRSSAEISYRVDGTQSQVTAGTIIMNIFSFDAIDFNNFTFETMTVPRTLATNTKAKKWMYIQFVIENNVAGEGFGFYEMELLYTIVGKYKG